MPNHNPVVIKSFDDDAVYAERYGMKPDSSVEQNPLSALEAIPHSPATDDELNSYARGIVEKLMLYPTPNCVASLLARVRQDNAELLTQARRIEALERRNEELETALLGAITELGEIRELLKPTETEPHDS